MGSLRSPGCPTMRPLYVAIRLGLSEGLNVSRRAPWGCGEPGSCAGQAGHAGLFGQGRHHALLGRHLAAAPGYRTSRSHSHGANLPYNVLLQATRHRDQFNSRYPEVFVYDLTVWSIPQTKVLHVQAVSPNGDLLATGSRKGCLHLWQLQDNPDADPARSHSQATIMVEDAEVALSSTAS